MGNLDRGERESTSTPGSSPLGGCRLYGTDGIPKKEFPGKEILMAELGSCDILEKEFFSHDFGGFGREKIAFLGNSKKGNLMDYVIMSKMMKISFVWRSKLPF